MTDVQPEEIDIDAEVEGVIEEAKESFSLVDRIKNRDMRTIKVDLGYDEVHSEKLIAIEATLEQLGDIIERMERNASGVDELKKLAAKHKRDIKKANAEDAGDLQDQLEETERQIQQRKALHEQLAPLRERLAELNSSADELREKVSKESLSVELRALPYAIASGSARRARARLGITEKGIPEDKQDDFQVRQLIELAYDQVVRFRDNKTGQSGTKLSVEEIEAIQSFMPLSQSAKFFEAVSDLQFRNAISESAIAQADF